MTPLTASFTWWVCSLHLETAKGSAENRSGFPQNLSSPHRWHCILKPNFSAEIPSPLHSTFSKLSSTLPAQLSSPYLRDHPLFVLGNSTSFLAFPAGARKFTELRSPLQCPFSPLTLQHLRNNITIGSQGPLGSLTPVANTTDSPATLKGKRDC